MVYEVESYNLIGKIINVYKERPELKVVPGEHGEPDTFVDVNTGEKADVGFRADLTQHLDHYRGKNNVQLVNKEDFPIYLPYFADVTQDLPGSKPKGLKPQTWKGCQLLTQKHGGYLEFYHHETKKTLRIAINSNTYEPAN